MFASSCSLKKILLSASERSNFQHHCKINLNVEEKLLFFLKKYAIHWIILKSRKTDMEVQ